MTKSDFISPREFAAILGVHYATVLESIKKGQIKAVKVGRQYRIPITELEATKQTQEKADGKESNTDS